MHKLIMYIIYSAVLGILHMQNAVSGVQAAKILNGSVTFRMMSPNTFNDSAAGDIKSSRDNTLKEVTNLEFDATEQFVSGTVMLNSTEGTKDMPVNSTLYLTCATTTSMKWIYHNQLMESPKTLKTFVVPETSDDKPVISTLKLHPKSYAETGRYSCVAVDTETTIGSIYIFVNEKDCLLLSFSGPFILTVYRNAKVEIPCLVTNSKASVTLLKGASDREVVSSNHFRFEPTKGIVIPEPTISFNGVFCCEAVFNAQKNLATFLLDFILPAKPHFSRSDISPSKVFGDIGEPVELLCQNLMGFPKPKVTWYREKVLVDDMNIPTLRYDDDKQKLIIDRFHLDDVGVYECRGENEYGAVSRFINLLVKKESPRKELQIIPLICLGVGVIGTLILLFVLGWKFYQIRKKTIRLRVFRREMNAHILGLRASSPCTISARRAPNNDYIYFPN